MNEGTQMRSKLLGLCWYFIFLLGFNAYIDTLPMIFFVGAIWGLFKAIEHFVPSSKLRKLVKALVFLFFLYPTGQYGNIFNPNWIYNLVVQIVYDTQVYFLGLSNDVVAMPLAFNLLFFIVFVEILLLPKSKKRLTLVATLACSCLLMFLAIWNDINFSMLTVLFVFIGIIKMTFDSAEENNIKIESDKFKLTLMGCIFLSIILVWNMSTPISMTLRESPQRIKVSGYNSNDTILGGPIELSERPVFRVKSEVPMYLRGESKHIYTGRGWADDNASTLIVNRLNIPMDYHQSVVYEEQKISIEVLNGNYPVVFSGLLTTRVDIDRSNLIVLANGNDIFINSKVITGGDTYEVVIQNPIFTDEVLRAKGSYNNDFPLELYTSLPGNLPYSIIDLAEEVTSPYTNNYDKAVAIRNYLTSREFRYSLDVESPPRGMDFVEHFLLEKEGYCEHYSTAFVVMARSVGIPARWVKGFTSGFKTSEGEYTIHDSNAHAWAEVYFPEAGWVMFETTPGFLWTDRDYGGNTNPVTPNNPGNNIEEPTEEPIVEEPQEKGGNDVGDLPTQPRDFRMIGYGLAIVFLGLISTRIFMVIREKMLTPEQRVVNLYNKILTKLRRLGYGKNLGETPKEYLLRISIEKNMPVAPLVNLTNAFESIYYGNNNIKESDYKLLKKEQKNYPYLKLALSRGYTYIKSVK